jgi:hypothetical protein
MNRSRFGAALALALVLMMAGLASLGGAAELPDQLVRFLPENSDGLLVVPSLDELDRKWAEIRDLMGDLFEEEEEPLPDLAQLLAMIPEPYQSAIDRSRPVAVSGSVPNPMLGQDTVFRVVLPVKDTDADFQGLAEILGSGTIIHKDGYLLISPQADVTESVKTNRLVPHLPAGTLRICIDQQSLWAQFGPMLEMGMAAMNAPQPPAADGTPAPPKPAMTTEQIAASADLIRGLFLSMDVLGFGLDLTDGKMLFSEKLTVLAGSALDPPAQPDFNTALDLSRMLPRDSDWAMAYAMDVPGLLDLYKDYYLMMLSPILMAGGAGQDAGAEEILTPLLEAMDQIMAPTAMTLNLGPDRIQWQYVMKTDHAQALADLQVQANQLIGQSAPFLRIETIEGLEAEGLKVLAWNYDLDPAAIPDTPESQDIAGMAPLFEKILPGVRMAVRDDLLLATVGRDLGPLTEMIKQSKQRRGAPHAELARIAKQAGPDCQGVFTGDMAPLFSMIFELTEEFSDEDMPRLELDPMPATLVTRVGQRAYSSECAVGLKGLVGFIKAMEELEEKADKRP